MLLGMYIPHLEKVLTVGDTVAGGERTMENEKEMNQAEELNSDDTNDRVAEDAEDKTSVSKVGEPSQETVDGDGQGDDREETTSETDDLRALVSDLESQLEEMNNRLLRAQADLENFRRRTRKEKEEQAKYASLPVIKALLPALDNLDRALSASHASDSSEGLVQGVEMVNRQIMDILKQEGLKPIQAVGEPFDPQYHEAVMQVEHEKYEPGIVVEELQKGYRLKDRVIRPSMVKVSQ